MKQLVKKLLGRQLIALLWHKPKAILAALLSGFPARSFTVIAVAGTKGKTSTAYFISQLLDHAGIPNALFSTAALKIHGTQELNTLKLTTPTPFFFQHFLRRARQARCTHLVVEVSSHALVQERLWSVPIHIVVLTNLTPDHLEYHDNEKDYQDTHLRLITRNLRHLIINGSDAHSKKFADLPCEKTVLTDAHPFCRECEKFVPLKGTFNLVNASFAYASVRALGVSEDVALEGIKSLRNAPGRMESIPNELGIDIIVDYAHSVESLKNFFSAIRPAARGRVIAVFGACGDRDPRQRPLMGAVLDESADLLIVTNDDPYSEDPLSIAAHLRTGVRTKKEGETLFTQHDRREAIARALNLARRGDTVCILGKGAEQWQVFKTKKIPWDDRVVTRELLTRART